MIIIPNMKKILVVIVLGLLLVLANDLINNFATAQQTPGADKIISLPPQTPTNILSSSPGSSVRPPAVQKWGAPATVPTTVLPQQSDPTVWGMIRHGRKGSVTIPDQNAALLVQSQGQTWRDFRNDSLFEFGAWVLLGILVALGIFYLARGRIKISHGRAGATILRFKTIERMTHWLTAIPFVVLALTGLNLMYGRDYILPLIGHEAFAEITNAGKWLHNFMAFAFMLGLVLMVVLWVRHNLWD